MTTLNYQINKRDVFFVLFVFVVALLFRTVYLNDYKNTDVYPILPHSDSDFYFLWAKDIASGDILGSHAFMKWPLYAYFLGFLFNIFKSSVFSIYALQFVLGAVNCVLVYFIAKAIFNEVIAFIAALLCAWYGLFIFYDGLLIYNTLSLFLNSLLFLILLSIQNNPNEKNLFWIGIFASLCTLTQANVIIFSILAVVWILWQKKLGLRKFICGFCSFLVGISIILGITTLRNYLVEKDFILVSSSTGFNFYIGNNPQTDGLFRIPNYLSPTADGMLRDAKIIAKVTLGKDLKISEVSNFWFNRAIGFIKNNPVIYSKLLFHKVIKLLSPKEFIFELEYYFIKDKIRIFKILFLDLRYILPFAFLGALTNLKKFKKAALLYLVLFSFSLNMILFFVQTKFRIAIVPFLIIFASYGMFSLWDAISKRGYLKFVLLCIAVFLIFILFNYGIITKNRSKHIQEDFFNFRYHLEKALVYEGNSDYKSAIQELELANQIKPNYHYVLFTFGVIYYRMNDFKMAEEKFKETIRVSPISVDAYYNLGLMYNNQQRFDEAKVTLEKAVFLDPDDVGAHFELGRAYKAIGNFKEAKREFSLAFKKINRWRTEERAIIENELTEISR